MPMNHKSVQGNIALEMENSYKDPGMTLKNFNEKKSHDTSWNYHVLGPLKLKKWYIIEDEMCVLLRVLGWF